MYETLVPAKYTLLMQLGQDTAFDKDSEEKPGKVVIVLPTAEQAKDLKRRRQL